VLGNSVAPHFIAWLDGHELELQGGRQVGLELGAPGGD
jgi:hypothetical protein